MELVTIFYIVNATLLLLHEIESAFEKEWEILKLPGKINGFLLIHIPIVLLLFYGAVEMDRRTSVGFIFGIVAGIGGLLPFVVHKIIVLRKEHFNSCISNILIYSNIVTGIITLVLSARFNV